jgi:hypothetical protein
VRRDYSDFEMRSICDDLKRFQMRRLNNSYGSHPKKKIGKRPWDYKTKNNCMIINP